MRVVSWGWSVRGENLVGAEGFEPPTLWSQTRCATRLRYAPTSLVSHAEHQPGAPPTGATHPDLLKQPLDNDDVAPRAMQLTVPLVDAHFAKADPTQ